VRGGRREVQDTVQGRTHVIGGLFLPGFSPFLGHQILVSAVDLCTMVGVVGALVWI
jgi:hypothetical protein